MSISIHKTPRESVQRETKESLLDCLLSVIENISKFICSIHPRMNYSHLFMFSKEMRVILIDTLKIGFATRKPS